MTNLFHYLFLCALFASCTNLSNEATSGNAASEEKTYAITDAPEPDSLYITRPQFSAPGISLPLVRVTKAKPADSNTIIKSSGSYHFPGNKINFYSLKADKGNKYELLLNKHKKILLNSASMLVFHPDIPNYMLLFGEGYFEVSQEVTIEINYKAKVMLSAGSIVNIAAYNNIIGTVTLLRGTMLSMMGNNSKSHYKAGYEIVFDAKHNTISEHPCDTIGAITWTKNDFSYRSITSKELLNRIANWYNKELIYPDSVVNKLGSFDGEYTESIPAIIDRVNRMYSGIDCRVEQNKLIVASK